MEVRLLDDWKGVVDPKQRRTLQNRLNQRAHRRRLKAKPEDDPAPVESADAAVRPSQMQLPDLDQLSVIGPRSEHTRRVLCHLEALLHAEFLAGSPRTDLLLGLTRVNFLRALHANIDVLGYSAAEMHDDALSQFGTAGPARSSLRDRALLPPALQPSPIQSAIPHHPWLDLLAIAPMRDNLILAGDSYDYTQLCRDMCGHGLQSRDLPPRRVGAARGETGVLIWGDPWDPEGWEVTETFLRRWGWAVRGVLGLVSHDESLAG
ncbi:hypothetical protein BDW62DRAFT_204005 [Aspergillus aurantiobrunneus]